MLKHIPTVGVPIYLNNINKGIPYFFSDDRRHLQITMFEKAFSEYLGVRYSFLVGSGTTAFYVILKAMREFSNKNEVILPAYTAPTLTIPIRKAGLKVVLCDISRETFNIDISSLTNVVNDKTLCVVPVHMFGFSCDLIPIMDFVRRRNIFVFEDACQALGANFQDKKLGTLGDVGCFSLSRGKNFTTYSGGIIVTNSSELAEVIKKEIGKLPLPTLFNKFSTLFKIIFLSLVVRPHLYGLFYPIIRHCKSTEPHKRLDFSRFTEFQAAIALSLLTKLNSLNQKRYLTGKKLYTALSNKKSLILPKIIHDSKPIFVHLPVVFKKIDDCEIIQRLLWKKGIDSARMYSRKPIHHNYDLGYKNFPDPFPNATYIANRLLILPTHYFVDDRVVRDIIEVFSCIG